MRGQSFLGLLVCSASLLGAAVGDVSQGQVSQGQVSQAKSALARLPLRFEENRGQFDPAVRYAARAGGYRVQLLAGGVSIANQQRFEIRLGQGVINRVELRGHRDILRFLVRPPIRRSSSQINNSEHPCHRFPCRMLKWITCDRYCIDDDPKILYPF